MLQHANPVVPLRLKDKRAVLNAVFADEVAAHTAAQARIILKHLDDRIKSVTVGQVSTAGIHGSKFLTRALTPVLDKLCSRLQAEGYVNTEDQAEVLFQSTELMATKGAVPHADTGNSEWHESLFWVYVLESEKADLVFPNLSHRVPMTAGQLIVFDPAQPHAVVGAGKESYRAAHFRDVPRQGYLAGTVALSKSEWTTLGVQTDSKALRRKRKRMLEDVCKLAISPVTGKFVLND